MGVLGASVGSAAERIAMLRSVIGNEVGFGFPARSEMTPGVCSSGNRPLTVQLFSVRTGIPDYVKLTWTGLSAFRLL